MKKAIIISVSVVVGVTALLGGWFMIQPSGPAYAAGALYRQAHFDGDHNWHRGRGHHRGQHAIKMVCSSHRDQTIETVTGFVEGFIDFTPEQEKSWKELTQAVDEGSAIVGQTCEKMAPKDATLSASENLARIETVLETGLSVVQRLRPAFASFYDSLSDKQKNSLERLLAHKHRRGHR